MKLKTRFFPACITIAALFLPLIIQAQEAAPVASASPGAPPKFGPDDQGGKGKGKGRPNRDPEARLAQMKEALGLTTEQETKIREIFRTEMEKMRADRKANKGNKPAPEERRAKMKAARNALEADIKAILTPDQQAKFAAMKKDRQDRGGASDSEIPKP